MVSVKAGKERVKLSKTGEDLWIGVVVHAFVALCMIITIVPILNVFSKAFSSDTAIVSNQVTIYPIGFQLSTVSFVLTSSMFSNAFVNTLIVTVLGTVLSVMVTALAAYPFSKKDMLFHKPLMLLFVFTMWFSGGLVPTYLAYRKLNMLNSLSVLIIPGAINVYNMLLVKNSFEALPDSLEESARIDGANRAQVFFYIILPLSKAVLATICLFTAVGLWNDFYAPMMYTTSTKYNTLALYLYNIVAESQSDLTMTRTSDDMMNTLPEAVRAASIVVSIVPILCVYPFLQKYFVKGVLIGAVKE